jgi:hypothetical protein
MKSLNTKLALSAVAVAMLATPALAQGSRHYQTASQHQLQDSANQDTWSNNQANPVGTYPNGALRSGSVYSRESGADENVIR